MKITINILPARASFFFFLLLLIQSSFIYALNGYYPPHRIISINAATTTPETRIALVKFEEILQKIASNEAVLQYPSNDSSNTFLAVGATWQSTERINVSKLNDLLQQIRKFNWRWNQSNKNQLCQIALPFFSTEAKLYKYNRKKNYKNDTKSLDFEATKIWVLGTSKINKHGHKIPLWVVWVTDQHNTGPVFELQPSMSLESSPVIEDEPAPIQDLEHMIKTWLS